MFWFKSLSYLESGSSYSPVNRKFLFTQVLPIKNLSKDGFPGPDFLQRGFPSRVQNVEKRTRGLEFLQLYHLPECSRKQGVTQKI